MVQVPRWIYALACLLFVETPLFASPAGNHKHSDLLHAKIGTPSQLVLRSAAKYLLSGDLDKATAVVNTGIKFDFGNAELHFLNALTYHQKYLQGKPDNYRLALSGYQIASRMDAELTAMTYLQITRLHMHARDYYAAKAAAAIAFNANPESPQALLLLLQAAMLTKDIEAADWAIATFEQRGWKEPLLIRLKAIRAVFAGNRDLARSLGIAYSEVATNPSDAQYVQMRIEQLNELGDLERPENKPSSDAQVSSTPQRDEATPTAAAGVQKVSNWFDCDPKPAVPTYDMNHAGDSGASDETIMAEVLPAPCENRTPAQAEFSVTLIAANESKGSSFGINLLEGLAGIWTLSNQYQEVSGSGTDRAFSRLSTKNFVLTNSIGSGEDILRYTLNIADSAYSKTEVFLRPTLSAIDRVPVVLYVGTTLTLAIAEADGYSSDIEDRSVGVSLAITPTFLANDDVMVSLRISKGTVVKTDSDGVLLAQNRSTLISSAILGDRDTYVLSGLTFDQSEESGAGVPALQNIPLLKQLFSTRTVAKTQVSLIALITYEKSPERRLSAVEGIGKIDPARALSLSDRVDAGMDPDFKLEQLRNRQINRWDALRRRDIIADRSSPQEDLEHIVWSVLRHSTQP